jgi:hypothetical protein
VKVVDDEDIGLCGHGYKLWSKGDEADSEKSRSSVVPSEFLHQALMRIDTLRENLGSENGY